MQVYEYARQAGFPPETARKMVAIAQRESSFRTDVVGTINKAKETSYGLWQINWKDSGIRALLIRNGIAVPEMLFDPAVNAKAAFLLWDGKDRNLDVAWYVDRVGLSYQQGEKYRAILATLPPASDWEQRRGGGAPPVIYAGGPAPSGPAPSGFTSFVDPSSPGDDSSMLLIAAGVGAAALVWVLT